MGNDKYRYVAQQVIEFRIKNKAKIKAARDAVKAKIAQLDAEDKAKKDKT